MKYLHFYFAFFLFASTVHANDNLKSLKKEIHAASAGNKAVELNYTLLDGSANCLMDSTNIYILAEKGDSGKPYKIYFRDDNGSEMFYNNDTLHIFNSTDKYYKTTVIKDEINSFLETEKMIINNFLPFKSNEEYEKYLTTANLDDYFILNDTTTSDGKLNHFIQIRMPEYGNGFDYTFDYLHDKNTKLLTFYRMTALYKNFAVQFHSVRINSSKYLPDIPEERFIPPAIPDSLEDYETYFSRLKAGWDESNKKLHEIEKIDKKNQPMSDWTLDRLNGGTLSYSELKGKPTLLFFYDINCPFSLQSMPEIEGISHKFKGKANIIGVFNNKNFEKYKEELKEMLRAFYKEKNLTFETALDQETVAHAHGILVGPVIVLLDKNGIISEIYEGFRSNMNEELSGKLNELLIK